MSAVWENPTIPATEKMVLLSLADHADDEGNCYPSIARLVERTGLKERAVQNAISRLKEGGFLTVEMNAGRRGTNLYIVHPTPAPNAPPHEMHPARDAPHPRTKCTPTPARGAPEPSVTINEPSEIHKARDAVRSVLEECASPAAVTSFIAYRRKQKGKALSPTAATRQAKQLKIITDRGGCPDDALGMAEERGWVSVQADWYFKAKGSSHGNRNNDRASANRPANGPDPALEQIARLAGLGSTSCDGRG